MVAKLYSMDVATFCVMVCPFCCQMGSLTFVISTLVLQYFFHSSFLWWWHFFVLCISLKVLCGCFIYPDEMFPATYPSVLWYAWMWMQNFIQWMLFCDMCNSVSALLSGKVTDCCSLTLVLRYFLHSCFHFYLHFFDCMHYIERTMWLFMCSDVKCYFNNYDLVICLVFWYLMYVLLDLQLCLLLVPGVLSCY